MTTTEAYTSSPSDRKPELSYSAEFACGARAVLTLSLEAMRCEWTPDHPRGLRGQRRRKFLAAYRTWRDECIANFSERTGVRIAVIDL